MGKSREVLQALRDDIKNLVAKYSPEELEIFDEMFDNIINEADRIYEEGEKILDSENTLGFFGGGILTLAISIIVSEVVHLIVEHFVRESAKGIKKIVRRVLKKSPVGLSPGEIEEIADELANILARVKLSG